MTPNPTFSVVVPVYQAEPFLLRSLESVAKQTCDDWEIVIIDNDSSDRSFALAKDWTARNPHRRSHLLVEPRLGPGAARNAGIEAACGEWIAFLDADDVWYPTKLEMVAACIRGNPGCDLICHSELAVSSDGHSRPLEYHKYYDPDTSLFLQLYTRNFLSPSAVTVRRSCLFKAGLFDPSLLCCEDHDLWLRLGRFVTPRFLPEVLGEYTEREESAIRDVVRTFSCDVRVGKKHFQEFAACVRHPYLVYVKRVLWSYASSAKACVVRGQLSELMRLIREAALFDALVPGSGE